MNKNKILAAFIAILLSVFAHDSSAHDGASGIVKERMEAMKSIGGAMKTIGAMVTGKKDYQPVDVQTAAGVIASHAHKVDTLFPDNKESRQSMVSEAAPSVWEKREDFLGLAEKMATTADLIAASAGDKIQALSEFKVLGGTCKSCHENFRVKKN